MRARMKPRRRCTTREARFLRVLERCQWTVEGTGQAAEQLQLKPSTLRNRMKKLGLARRESSTPRLRIACRLDATR